MMKEALKVIKSKAFPFYLSYNDLTEIFNKGKLS